jgi:hypothetical protein
MSAIQVEPSSSTNTLPTGEQLDRAGDEFVQHRLQRFLSWLGNFDEFRRPVNVTLGVDLGAALALAAERQHPLGA